ncbi:MAG TPA: SRPBCC family protein [Telluria sp.]
MLNRVVTVAALAMGGYLLSKQMKKGGPGSGSTVEESIEVNVPLSTAYNQWTQFEEFPRFMDSVHEVRQVDDRHLHWRADVAGKEKEWDAEITEQIPDRRIAWRSTSGVPNGGVVTFHRINDTTTKIMLQMQYTPEGAVESIGDALGAVRMEARRNLERFKEMIEARGKETGAWRGEVTQH